MTVATIDVGTNTALLLVAEVAPPDRLQVLREEQRFIRLGEGVDAEGRIREAALERLIEALLAYREIARACGARRILVGATSASRDAQNRGALVRSVRERTGLDYRILSGDEEARWSFLGAVSAFPDLQGPCFVVDVGGGSTEIVLGEPSGGAGAMRYRCSLDVGSVRLTERFFSSLPPSRPEVEAAEAFAERLLDGAALPFGQGYPIIGAAGTAGALALVHHGASAWRELGDGAVSLSAADVRMWRGRLLERSCEEVLALNPDVLRGRADVFAAGVLLLDLVLRHLGADRCRISPRGLRHGLALWLASGSLRGPTGTIR